MKVAIAVLLILVSYAVSSKAGTSGECSFQLVEPVTMSKAKIFFSYSGGISKHGPLNSFETETLLVAHKKFEQELTLKRSYWPGEGQYVLRVLNIPPKHRYDFQQDYYLDLYVSKDFQTGREVLSLEYKYLRYRGVSTTTTLATCEVVL